MGLVTVLLGMWRDDGHVDTRNRRVESPPQTTDAQCRSCGRYYSRGLGACPHCESANQLRDGPPPG